MTATNDYAAARNRLTAMIRGEEIGIDELALLKIVDEVMQDVPDIICSDRFAHISADGYKITLNLKMEFGEETPEGGPFELTYNAKVAIPITDDNEEIKQSLKGAISRRRSRMRNLLYDR